ncbi:MAG: hypothetical protein AAF529_04730 [Pseudomonadota bacterium]
MLEAMITGEWRQPTNTAAHQKGGIHDDATATDLGFKGGTVAGSIHMEQFTPLLEEAFGEAYWRSGGLSLYFRSATVDQEPVRCFIAAPEQVGDIRRAAVWMENEAGTLILSGTASCDGHDAGSELRARLAEIRPVTELRILDQIQVGDRVDGVEVLVENEHVDRQLQVITEPMACYQTTERFGARVLPMTGIVRSFDPAEQRIVTAAKQPFVGMYGAIEIEYINGPVFSEKPYQSSGEIAGLTDSPKTEVLWRDMLLEQDGQPIARMLKMDRILKDSSPLWQA